MGAAIKITQTINIYCQISPILSAHEKRPLRPGHLLFLKIHLRSKLRLTLRSKIMAQIFKFPTMTPSRRSLPCNYNTWHPDNLNASAFNSFILHIALEDKYLVSAILKASQHLRLQRIQTAAVWQLSSAHYNDKKLCTILKSAYQTPSQIKAMLRNEVIAFRNYNNAACRDYSHASTETCGLRKMRAYLCFKKICTASLGSDNVEQFASRAVSATSFTEALFMQLKNDNLCKGSILQHAT